MKSYAPQGLSDNIARNHTESWGALFSRLPPTILGIAKGRLPPQQGDVRPFWLAQLVFSTCLDVARRARVPSDSTKASAGPSQNIRLIGLKTLSVIKATNQAGTGQKPEG